MIENPENYRKKWDRPLHCVRYNDQFFASLLEKNNLRLDRFDHEKEADGQSGLYIRQAT